MNGSAGWRRRSRPSGEREALDQLEISAGQEPGWQRIHRRQLVDDLLALEDAPGEDQRPAAQPLLRALEVVGFRGSVRQDEEVDRVAKELHLHQVRMRIGVHHDPEVHGSLHRGVEHHARRRIGKVELDARVAFEEPAHPLRQEVGTQRFVATDHEAADLVALQALDPVLDLLEPCERFIREAQKLLARAGQ